MTGKPPVRSVAIVLVAFLIALSAALPLSAQGAPTGVTVVELHIRAGPGREYASLAVLPPGATVLLEGRDESAAWGLVHTPDGAAHGWVFLAYVALPLGFDPHSLSLVMEDSGVPGDPAAAVVNAPAVSTPPTATTISNLRLRAGPGREHPDLGTLPARTAVIVEGRNDAGNWALVHTPDGGLRGWVTVRYLRWGEGSSDVAALPVVDERLASEEYSIMDRLRATPVVATATARAREIYRQGLALGNHPHRFSKVGDCQSVPQFFLAVFDSPGSYALGPNADLQATIDHFAGSFSRESMAVWSGFNLASVLDPTWANPAFCRAGESPQACEYRLWQPAFVIISMETWHGRTTEQYEDALRQVLDFWIGHGVVPILGTKADNREGDWSINATIARVAWEYDIPLWNFLMAAQPLEGYGTTDGFHLTYAPDFYDNPENMRAAWPWRNLTALQSLDAVWRGVQ